MILNKLYLYNSLYTEHGMYISHILLPWRVFLQAEWVEFW